ncbi:MAG: VWA domain-containing protein [Lachnospiraceae bacterium]|nr:VWA domain-containing protein [Lachnospiraceae bacterium]
MKKIVWILVLILTLGVFPNIVCVGEEEEKREVILVIDVSGSMKYSDVNKTALEAAKMFVDLSVLGENTIGVIAFNGSIAKTIPMTKLLSNNDKRYIKEEIDSFTYEGETDIGMALSTAVHDLSNYSGNQKMIVLFTDGHIELENENTRTKEDSLTDVNDALNKVKGQYPIYTIGLNSNGKVDEELLETISDESDGQCFLVDKAEELPDVFHTIFADFIQSNITDLGSYTLKKGEKVDFSITIPDENVLEANIVLLTDSEITDVAITNVEGEVRVDQDQVVMNTSDSYTLIKLKNPKEGEYSFSVTGSKKCEIQIKLLFQYDITLNTEVTRGEEGSRMNIKASLVTDESVALEDSFFKQFVAQAVITKPDGTEEHKDMTYGNGSYVLSYEMKDAGDYKVKVTVSGDNFYRTSEENILTYEGLPVTEAITEVPSKVTPILDPETGKEKGNIGTILIIVVIAGGCVAAAAVFLTIHKKKNRPFYGVLEYTVEFNDTTYTKRYRLTGKRKSIKMSSIITEPVFVKKLKLNKIELFPDNEHGRYAVKIMNHSDSVVSKGISFNGRKDIILGKEETCSIKTPESPQGIMVLMTYRLS